MAINSIPDLCEIEVTNSPCEGDAGKVACKVELRLASEEINLGGEECRVGFKKVTISVDMDGMAIVSGSRFGDPVKENKVRNDKKTSQKFDESGGVAADIGVEARGKPKFSVLANMGRSHKKGSSTDFIEEAYHWRVKARPNNRWEVKEYDDTLLDGTYLSGESLYEAIPNLGANRKWASLDVRVKQRDLVIKEARRNEIGEGFFGKLDTNKRRLLDIFIAKSLSSATSGQKEYSGEIKVSHYEHTDEG